MNLVQFTAVTDELDRAKIMLNPMGVTYIAADPEDETQTLVHLSGGECIVVIANLDKVHKALNNAMAN